MNEYYSEKANLIQYKVNHYKRITSYCTVLKISSFMGMLISLFVLWNTISWLVPIFILLLILFIIACALQGKFYRKVLFFNAYKKVLNIEIDADNGIYDELSSGDEYINTDHLFTSDLDIFGNNGKVSSFPLYTITTSPSSFFERILASTNFPSFQFISTS